MTHVKKRQTQAHKMLVMLMMKLLYRMEAEYGTDGRASARQMKSCSFDCHKPVWEDSCGVFMKCGRESERSAWGQRGGVRRAKRDRVKDWFISTTAAQTAA